MEGRTPVNYCCKALHSTCFWSPHYTFAYIRFFGKSVANLQFVLKLPHEKKFHDLRRKITSKEKLNGISHEKRHNSPMSLNLERAVFKKEKYSRDAQEVKAKAI